MKFRASTLDERKKFYKSEFRINNLKSWFADNKIKIPQIWAIDAGSDSGIIKDKKWKNFLFYFPFKELKEKIEKYAPEDIYYDRNIYSAPKKILKTLNFDKCMSQELVFDIDAENITCLCRDKKVCNKCIRLACNLAFEMKKLLEKNENFKKIKIVYSGKGFHIHVLDNNASKLTTEQREKLNKKYSEFPIDPWVSQGNIRLIRAPHTLNGTVSRIAMPVDSERSFKKNKSIPKFMKKD